MGFNEKAVKAALAAADKEKQGTDVIPAAPGQAVPGDNAPFFAPVEQPQGMQAQGLQLPQQVLQGQVSENVNPLMLAAKSAVLGLGEVPEIMGNSVLGAVNQMAGVPVQQRLTVADLARLQNPLLNNPIGDILGLSAKSPSEMLQSKQYQAERTSSPVNQGIADLSALGGSFAFPNIAGDIVGAAKLVKGIPQLAKFLPALEAMGKNPLARGASSAATGAGYAGAFGAGQNYAQTKQLPTAEQTATNMGLGATMGLGIPLLAKGAKGIYNKLTGKAATKAPAAATKAPAAIPMSEQKTETEAAAHLQSALHGMTDINAARTIYRGFSKAYGDSEAHRDELAKVFKLHVSMEAKQDKQVDLLGQRADKSVEVAKTKSQLSAQNTQQKQSTDLQNKKVLVGERAKASSNLTQKRADLSDRNNERSANRRQANTEKTIDKRDKVRLVEKQDNRQYNEKKTTETRQYNESKTANTRQYNEGQRSQQNALNSSEKEKSRNFSERQKNESRQHSDNKDRTKGANQAGTVASSGDEYQRLYDEIKTAPAGDLEALEKAIYSPGVGQNNQRLLDSPQQQNLAKQLARRRRELAREEQPEAPPGKPPGKAQAAPRVIRVSRNPNPNP